MLFFWSWGFLFPFFCFLVSVILLMFATEWSCEFSIFLMEFGTTSVFLIDPLSLIFFFVVGLVSASVLIYSVYYMESVPLKEKFIFTMILFVLSMFLLASSADLFWVMVGWDGLGLTSLCLIMFFQNWKSFNSSMVTFLSNRLGDALILISLVWYLGVGGSSSKVDELSALFSLFILFGAFSKSAQVPFSAWLPLAMAAPTPVSSLVHSSTLVTAGVYLLVRFKNFLSLENKMVILFISSITIFLSASSSLGEYDLKKIIALSTLSHIGLMMMFISFSAYFSVVIHLHAHAMFKSLLFMIAGDLIHKKGNDQDVRNLSISSVDFPTGVSLCVSLFSMIGLPFLAGFFSKELFLAFVSGEKEWGKLMMLITAASLTSSYSFRILFSLFSSSSKMESSISFSPFWVVFIIMSVAASVSSGLVVYLMSSSDLSIWLFTVFSLKKEIFAYLLLGGMIGIFFSKIQGLAPFSLLKSIHKMWWVDSLCFFIQKFMFFISWSSFFKMDAKGASDFTLLSKGEFLNSYSKATTKMILPFPLFISGASFISLTLWILFSFL